MLSDKTIREHLEKGDIEISPFDPKLINPCSYDVRLSEHGFARFAGNCPELIDPLDKSTYPMETFSSKTVILPPGGFCLGTTEEYLSFNNNIVGVLMGKSSLARVGLLIHVTAGLLDVGFGGQVVLEFANLSGRWMKLTAGMKIGQVTYFHTDEVEEPYNQKKGSKYHNQKPGQGSLYYLNKEEDNV